MENSDTQNQHYIICVNCGEVTQEGILPRKAIPCPNCGNLHKNIYIGNQPEEFIQEISRLVKEYEGEFDLKLHYLENFIRSYKEFNKAKRSGLGVVNIDLSHDHNNTTAYRLKWYSFLNDYFELILKHGMAIPVDRTAHIDFFGEYRSCLQEEYFRNQANDKIRVLMQLFEENLWDD